MNLMIFPSMMLWQMELRLVLGLVPGPVVPQKLLLHIQNVSKYRIYTINSE